MLSSIEESRRGYDFLAPENVEKWKGMFINSLRKVLDQVHPSLMAEESALYYVESLCLKLLGMLCSSLPLTVQDVEERVEQSFPTPIDRWALNDAKDTVDRTKKKKSIFPTGEVHQMLQKEVLLYKIDTSVSIFIVAILEYICADILKLAGNYVKKISQKSGYFNITCQDIKTAMCADKVLMDMFYQEDEAASTSLPVERSTPSGGVVSYTDLVRDLISDERHFLRELHLIIRVFKEEIERVTDKDSKVITRHSCYMKKLSVIFDKIVNIYELTERLLGNLEDAMEVAQDSSSQEIPMIGRCFEDMAETEEFRAYSLYANEVLSHESREALQNIVDDPTVSERLETAGHGFRLAVKYYLPRLLMAPVGHVFLYCDYISLLMQAYPDDRDDSDASDDRDNFKQVECNLLPIKNHLMKLLGNGHRMDAVLRMATRARRQLAIKKINELSRLDNWDNRHIGQCCNEFIREDTLSKVVPGKRISERRAYLFDGLLLLCKPVNCLGSGSAVGGLSSVVNAVNSNQSQKKIKETLFIRKLELIDRNDTDEYKNCVELVPRSGQSVVLSFASNAEKRNWLADLVMLYTKSMLERTLDSILLDLEKKDPLRFPSPERYRFAVPDSPENLVLEKRENSSQTDIKGATLLKLVERLTYHVYADLNFVRTFLTTYRAFCKPQELMELLIERFQIPPLDSSDGISPSDIEKLNKRYKKEFVQPVKFRVINVLRHWVDQHFYDFERDPELLEKLKAFLDSVTDTTMKKWAQSVLKIAQRKIDSGTNENPSVGVSHVFEYMPPLCLRHVEEDPEKYGWHILALNPLELARQLTLLEFDLYRTVKSSELVGAVWTKRDKDITSPNVIKTIRHSTRFTHWIEKCIVDCENFEERVAVVIRVLETAVALNELNNFNGVIAIVSAMQSASINRLELTKQAIPARLSSELQKFSALNDSHFKMYKEKLHSINPPCVPFFGIYLTYITQIEAGNKDFIGDTGLINFSKQRLLAKITGEIHQYQNQPYCLSVDPKTRAFLENLDPFPGMTDDQINNYLYKKSVQIESQYERIPKKCPRRWPELSLKSPGIKAPRRHGTHEANNDDSISLSSTQLSPTSHQMNRDSSSVASLSFGSLQDVTGEDRFIVSPKSGGNAFNIFNVKKISNTITKNQSSATYRKDEHKCDDTTSYTDGNRLSANNVGSKTTLSPKSPVIDANIFYGNDSGHHGFGLEPKKTPKIEKESSPVPPPPTLPPRAVPVPPQRPGSQTNSPKRPLPAPDATSTPSEDDVGAFPFGEPLTAPPLPPRRCKPPPPLPPRQENLYAERGGVIDAPCLPPLPPRQATTLMRDVHQSAILRRRYKGSAGPQLPPKPPLAALNRT